MSPRKLMITGAVLGVAIFALSLFSTFGLILFAAGALFGKGYGVWEERNKKATS